MSARCWVLLAALALACSSSDESHAEPLQSGGSGGADEHGAGASPGGSSSAADAGLAPTSTGGTGLPSAECRSRQRRHFEDRGLLASGTLRGLLEALDEPEAFWEQLPNCSAGL